MVVVDEKTMATCGIRRSMELGNLMSVLSSEDKEISKIRSIYHYLLVKGHCDG